jgi:hypothetical protein
VVKITKVAISTIGIAATPIGIPTAKNAHCIQSKSDMKVCGIGEGRVTLP